MPASYPPDAGKCELDMHGTTMSGAVSLSRRLTAGQSDDLVAGRVSPPDVLSPVQIAYLRDGRRFLAAAGADTEVLAR